MIRSPSSFSITRSINGGRGGGAISTSFLLRNQLHHLPRHSLPPPSLKLLPTKLHLSRLHATLAADSGEPNESETQLPEMAKAFHISSRAASAISVCIAVAALTLPLAMRSLGHGADLKTRALSYLTLLLGFYMAGNIGANDVANAMGTSVGSGALTLRQAVLTAAVLEFSGALLMGTHVTSTMQKGILVVSEFQGKESLLVVGLLSSLAAAGSWLQEPEHPTKNQYLYWIARLA